MNRQTYLVPIGEEDGVKIYTHVNKGKTKEQFQARSGHKNYN